MREGDVVLPWQQAYVGFTIDAVEIGDVLRAVIGERRETDDERIVVVTQLKLVAGYHRSVANLIVAAMAA